MVLSVLQGRTAKVEAAPRKTSSRPRVFSFRCSGPAGWHFWFYRSRLQRLKLPHARPHVHPAHSLKVPDLLGWHFWFYRSRLPRLNQAQVVLFLGVPDLLVGFFGSTGADCQEVASRKVPNRSGQAISCRKGNSLSYESLHANFQPRLASLHANFQHPLASLQANFQPPLASLSVNLHHHLRANACVCVQGRKFACKLSTPPRKFSRKLSTPPRMFACKLSTSPHKFASKLSTSSRKFACKLSAPPRKFARKLSTPRAELH